MPVVMAGIQYTKPSLVKLILRAVKHSECSSNTFLSFSYLFVCIEMVSGVTLIIFGAWDDRVSDCGIFRVEEFLSYPLNVCLNIFY